MYLFDIALNLAATAIRIEAPIPGKAAIGIEVPNQIQPVFLREVLETKMFAQSPSALPLLWKGYQRDTCGNDLAKMPHLLSLALPDQAKRLY